jgi:hypothetical protein
MSGKHPPSYHLNSKYNKYISQFAIALRESRTDAQVLFSEKDRNNSKTVTESDFETLISKIDRSLDYWGKKEIFIKYKTATRGSRDDFFNYPPFISDVEDILSVHGKVTEFFQTLAQDIEGTKYGLIEKFSDKAELWLDDNTPATSDFIELGVLNGLVKKFKVRVTETDMPIFIMLVI